MLNKLESLKKRYEELGAFLGSPDAMNDRKVWQESLKEHSALEEIVTVFDKYKAACAERDELDAMLHESDGDMRAMIHEEIAALDVEKERLNEELKVLLLPKDPNDDRNVMIEIRAGTGGDEAALFGAVLLRMYQRYAERHFMRTELISISETEMGGVKEAVLCLKGKAAYSKLKFESGVHRVQRVPETESQGRIHTSAATVAVLPEA